VHYSNVAAFVILVGAALGIATVVFQPETDKPDLPEGDYVIANNGDVNETTSTMLTSGQSHKRGIEDAEEKQETETQEFTAEQKSRGCVGGACDTPDSSKNSKIFNVSEEVDFSEEIQRLLRGEEIQFIDEND